MWWIRWEGQIRFNKSLVGRSEWHCVTYSLTCCAKGQPHSAWRVAGLIERASISEWIVERMWARARVRIECSARGPFQRTEMEGATICQVNWLFLVSLELRWIVVEENINSSHPTLNKQRILSLVQHYKFHRMATDRLCLSLSPLLLPSVIWTWFSETAMTTATNKGGGSF